MRIDAESRLFELIELMRRPGGASVQEMCDRIGCARTSFYRYETKLQAMNVPVYVKDDYNGNTSSKRWYIDEKAYASSIPIKLDHTERMMLRSIIDRTRIFEKTKLKARMDGLRTKLNAALIHDQIKPLITTHYNFKGTVSYEGKEDIIDTLCTLIEERRLAAVTYQGIGAPEPKTYDIEPLTLVDHNGALYVIVTIPKYERNIRILAVDRIKALEGKQTRFNVPEDFNPEAYLKPAFGIVIEEPFRVRVRFTGGGAFYAQERVDDETVVVSFTAAGLEEIAAWVLSWGPEARALGPETLVEKVKAELEEALKGY